MLISQTKLQGHYHGCQMKNRIIKKLFSILLLSAGMLIYLGINSPRAEAVNFTCSKSDAAYGVTINVDPGAPAWVRGCFQRITVNEGFTGAISFMYFSPETNDLSSGDKNTTLKILYYYRGTAGVNYAGMCPKITSTSNSDGQTNVMSIPDAGFGFSLTCSGWLAHNSWSSASGVTTLYASKFTAGTNKTITMNYDVAFTFTNDISVPGGNNVQCKDYYGKPSESDWKNPPCINNGSNYAFVNIIKTPPTFDGTISVAKYRNGTTPDQFPSFPSVINDAQVGLDHSPPDSWSPTLIGNPGIFNNIWVNPSTHTSNTQGNYHAYVNVPRGWKVVSATNRGGIATLHGNCSGGGKCSVHGVTVDNNGTTKVNFFFEPDVIGNLDGICTSPNETSEPQQPASQNGKIWGWVKDSYNNGGFSKVDIYIDGGPGNAAWGARVDANKPREAAVGGNYGFEVDVPSRFFDGNEHSLRIYVLRNNGGFDGGAGIGNNPYQLAIVKTSYNGIISVENTPQNPKTGKFSCPPPTGRVTCLKEGDNNFIQGWTFDPQKTEGPSQVYIYYDDAPGGGNDRPQGVTGSIKLSEAEITARKNEGYRGVDDNGLYRFRVSIPDRLHDGNNHEIRVYMITEGNNTPNPALEFVNINSTVLNIGPNNPNCGKVDKWNWPWLQTQNGDVIASGEITGQKVGTNLPGARPADKFDKEAEYMVISMLGGGGPFCSTYEYILTNTQATTNDQSKCDNGGGYGTLSLYSLNESGEDKIYKAVEDAFIANGSGNSPENTKCSPYNTLFEGRFNPIDTGIEGRGQPTCLNGTIIKASGSLSNIVVNSGRNTIFSDSELFIFGDITYSTDPRGYFQPNAEKKVPNLAIVVKGDIKIAPSVKRIDAALYATGKIYTCNGNGNPGQTSPPENCREQLVVNGSLISKDGYLFGRSFTNASRSPAELIQLTGQTLAFPPPGLDNRYFEDFSNKIRIDTSEFEPKF